jgi:hypothetical protein
MATIHQLDMKKAIVGKPIAITIIAPKEVVSASKVSIRNDCTDLISALLEIFGSIVDLILCIEILRGPSRHLGAAGDVDSVHESFIPT